MGLVVLWHVECSQTRSQTHVPYIGRWILDHWITREIYFNFLFLFLQWFLGYLGPYSRKAMATHSNTLVWKIPWTEEPSRLQSMESLRVGHDWATSLSLFTFMHWRRKWQPTPVFLPGESQGWVSLVGCHLWGRTESTQLKRCSSSNSRTILFSLHVFVFLCFFSSWYLIL